jgi:hypothetical protein
MYIYLTNDMSIKYELSINYASNGVLVVHRGQ